MRLGRGFGQEPQSKQSGQKSGREVGRKRKESGQNMEKARKRKGTKEVRKTKSSRVDGGKTVAASGVDLLAAVVIVVF